MKKSIGFVSRLTLKMKVGLSIGVVVVAGLGFWIYHSASAASAPTTGSGRSRGGEQVTVASVSSLSPENASLSVIGQVTSENQATILSQTAGEIVSLNKQLGNTVSAGDVIATIENSTQQAAVTQAQGSYDAVQATLSEVSGTNANNSAITSSEANENAQNTQLAVQASMKSLYTAIDDAVIDKADTLFSYHNSTSASLNLILNYSNDYDTQLAVENERPQLDGLLASANSIAINASSTDIDASAMLADAQTVESFLDNLSQVVDATLPDSSDSATLAGFNTAVGQARTEVTAAVTSLTSAKTSYDSASASGNIAANTAGSGTDANISVATANVQQALGALDAAKANLEKTIIRSPISGTIVSLPITNGDYVASFANVAQVSNPSALKVTTHVTAQDAETLSVGNSATINGNVSGIITQISPAIDPTTGTIEVDIGITGSQSGLIDGDSVTVDLNRTTSAIFSAQNSLAGANASSTSKSVGSNTSQIIIPIVALKITPTGPIVFTVGTSTPLTLVSNPVQIGSILGSNIVVTQGLTPSMMIVTDARGLTDGEIVTVKKP